MNIKNRINTICLILFIMFVISSCHLKGNLTILDPYVENNGTKGLLEISKIEFTDTATVFHFDAYLCTKSGCWFRIGRKAELQGSNQTYKLIGYDGIVVGEETRASESGHVSFILYFEPLDKSEKSVDFNDGYRSMSGIKLYHAPQTTAIQCTLNGEIIDRPHSKRLMLNKEGRDCRSNHWVSIPIRDGKFAYKMNCEYEEFYELIFWDEYINGIYRLVKFISEQGTIHFALHNADNWDENIVEGGKLNKEYIEYTNEASIKYDEIDPSKNIRDKIQRITNEEDEKLYYQIVRADSTYTMLGHKLRYRRVENLMSINYPFLPFFRRYLLLEVID